MIELEQLSLSIKSTVSLPDKVAEVLRGMILAGKWRPGDRIVETRVARQLGIGQPTVREALGKLEEAGLIQRHLNSGCVVTQLSKKELGQMFQVRIELECLAVELATESKDDQKEAKLRSAFAELQKTALKSNVEEYYLADFKFHRAIWRLANNRFLEKTLSQLVIPLFNFTMLELLDNSKIDFVVDADEHCNLVELILSGDKKRARTTVRAIFGEFMSRGLALMHPSKTGTTATRKSTGPRVSKKTARKTADAAGMAKVLRGH